MKRTSYKVLSHLNATMSWSNEIDIYSFISFLSEDDGLPRVFLGSGGSLSAAHLAAQLSVESGIVGVAMTPYQYIFSAWKSLPAKIVILSAAGRNVDAINAYKTAKASSWQQVGALIFTPSSKLESLMRSENETNVFTFNLLYSDGFLATNSLLAFYIVLLRAYRKETIEIRDWEFVSKIEEELRQFIKTTYHISTENWDSHNAALYEARETDRFYVLYSPDTLPIAYDMESRFSEGSVGCLQISDYRNFAHGRFNWFHQRKGQTAIIALISPENEAVANGILSEIPADIPIMKLGTECEGSNGTIELLLKSMYLANSMGNRWGMDISAPNVATFGKIIHSKDFLRNTNATETQKSDESISLPSTIKADILSLPIANITSVSRNIIRGETLWAKRNRKYVWSIADYGIEHVIDLGSSDYNAGLAKLCQKANVEYHHFRIDENDVADVDILQSLPELFRLLDDDNCYISCQQGLYRTDLLLAIYYMFHNQKSIPTLKGHIKKEQLKCDDIMRRLKRLHKALTPSIADTIGLTMLSEGEFRHRRKILLETNRKLIENTRWMN